MVGRCELDWGGWVGSGRWGLGWWAGGLVVDAAAMAHQGQTARDMTRTQSLPSRSPAHKITQADPSHANRMQAKLSSTPISSGDRTRRQPGFLDRKVNQGCADCKHDVDVPDPVKVAGGLENLATQPRAQETTDLV